VTLESESFDQSKITKNYLRETGSEMNKIDNVRVDGLKTLPISSFFEFKNEGEEEAKRGQERRRIEEWRGGVMGNLLSLSPSLPPSGRSLRQSGSITAYQLIYFEFQIFKIAAQ
jgi:hypothetical protein